MALSLGKTLTELDELPESELMLWQEFYQEQPFGLWRDDLRTGLIASTVANTVSSKSFKPIDFMPFEKHEDSELIEDLDNVIIIQGIN